MSEVENVRTAIRQFIAQHFPLSQKRQFTDDASLLESGIVDSIGILEIVSYLEQEFAIQVSDDDLLPENFGSISGIAAFVERKAGSRTASGDFAVAEDNSL